LDAAQAFGDLDDADWPTVVGDGGGIKSDPVANLWIGERGEGRVLT
jgi:hypothetical protein